MTGRDEAELAQEQRRRELVAALSPHEFKAIALLAGVPVDTVKAALVGGRRTLQKTRHRIARAARRLGWRRVQVLPSERFRYRWTHSRRTGPANAHSQPAETRQ